MIQVRVPATTANLGPGFDCMGLALDLWNTFELRLEGEPGEAKVQVLGEGEAKLPHGKDNMVFKIVESELGDDFAKLDRGLMVRCHTGVPAASGLGSSSTAVVAGAAFAAALKLYLNGARDIEPEMIDMDDVLKAAVRIEGHGDNVGPAIKGGLLLIMPSDQGLIFRSVPFEPLKVVVCVPEFDYLTVDARSRLPKTVPHADAVFNLGRSMFMLRALTVGDDALLAEACDDRLHQPYRMPDIPGAENARTSALAEGATAVALSGAGPGVLAFARSGHTAIGRAMQTAFSDAGLASRWWVLDAAEQGTSVRRLP